MIYYLFATVFPLVCWGLYDGMLRKNEYSDKDKNTLKKWLTFLAVLPMFLLFVLRFKRVGGDTIGYIEFFEKSVRDYSLFDLITTNLFEVEKGYKAYVKLLSYITDSYTVYFLITGIITFGTLYRFSLKYTKNPFVFFFLFISLGTYSFFITGLRQSLAITICLWAVDFIKDRKPIKFILAVILASLFHKSAVIFFVAYPLSSIKRYDWILFIYLVLTVVLIIGFSFFQNVFNELLGYTYNIEETGNGGIFMLLVLVLTAYSLYVTYDQKDGNKISKTLVHLSLLTSLFWILRLISRTAERVSFYFICGLYAYFSQAISVDSNDKYVKMFKWLLILGCLILFVYRNLGATYLFFWQGV